MLLKKACKTLGLIRRIFQNTRVVQAKSFYPYTCSFQTAILLLSPFCTVKLNNNNNNSSSFQQYDSNDTGNTWWICCKRSAECETLLEHLCSNIWLLVLLSESLLKVRVYGLWMFREWRLYLKLSCWLWIVKCFSVQYVTHTRSMYKRSVDTVNVLTTFTTDFIQHYRSTWSSQKFVAPYNCNIKGCCQTPVECTAHTSIHGYNNANYNAKVVQ